MYRMVDIAGQCADHTGYSMFVGVVKVIGGELKEWVLQTLQRFPAFAMEMKSQSRQLNNLMG